MVTSQQTERDLKQNDRQCDRLSHPLAEARYERKSSLLSHGEQWQDGCGSVIRKTL